MFSDGIINVVFWEELTDGYSLKQQADIKCDHIELPGLTKALFTEFSRIIVKSKDMGLLKKSNGCYRD